MFVIKLALFFSVNAIIQSYPVPFSEAVQQFFIPPA